MVVERRWQILSSNLKIDNFEFVKVYPSIIQLSLHSKLVNAISVPI